MIAVILHLEMTDVRNFACQADVRNFAYQADVKNFACQADVAIEKI